MPNCDAHVLLLPAVLFFELRLRRLPAVAAEDGYTDSAALRLPRPSQTDRLPAALSENTTSNIVFHLSKNHLKSELYPR